MQIYLLTSSKIQFLDTQKLIQRSINTQHHHNMEQLKCMIINVM
jgi:hypothetical protein